ncbi:MAG: BatA domain-containing protein [Phycisphaerae bacterium]
MPFIHPAIFWAGLGAASAPIIIHLLNRRRFKIRDWAAMQFLLDSIRKNRRRLRIEELLLLLIRTLAVLLLGLALARFTGCGMTNVLPSAEGSQTIVYVLDDSYSMGQKAGTAPIFETARQDLVEQIQNVPKTDKIAIVLASQPRKPFFELQFNADPEALGDRVKGLKPSTRRADLAESLERARAICRTSDAATKRVYLLSDFRKVDLTPREKMTALKQQFGALAGDNIDLVTLDYGREAKNNLTVAGLEMLNRFAVAKMPFRVKVLVRNNGPRTAENIELRVRGTIGAGEKEMEFTLPVQNIDRIAPRESRAVEVKVLPEVSGPAVVTAELPADDLHADNTASLAVRVRPAIRVLLVDGRPNVVEKKAETFYLRTAIDPYDDKRYGTSTEVLAVENLASARFSEYDMVVLADVPEFPLQMGSGDGTRYAMLAELEDYIRNGGGLMIFVGDQMNPTFYGEDGAFYAGGSGLLPYPLGPRRTAMEGEFFRIDPRSIAPDSIMGVFAGERAALTQLVRFKHFAPAQEMAAAPKAADIKPPRVIARYTDGENSPLAITRRYGEGSVVLLTTTAHARWTDWPKDRIGTYVNMLFNVLRNHSRAHEQSLTAKVTESIVHPISNEMLDATATLETPLFPEADLVSLRPKTEQNPTTGIMQNLLEYQRADIAGVYTISLKTPAGDKQHVYYARNVDPEEGDLAPGKENDLIAALGTRDFQYKDRAEQSGTSIVTAEIDKEYWMWALAAAALLLGLETWLGQKFGHYSA